MMKEEIKTPLAPQPAGSYSQGIKVGNRIYVAGQVPRDPVTREVPDGIEAQTHLTLTHVKHILEVGGATMDDVVKVTVHLTDLNHFQAFNSVYQTFFQEPYPVRTTVGSQLRGVLVEVDVVAEITDK